MSHRNPVLLSAALLGLACFAAFAGEPPPPRIEPFVETANGVEIRDPYRWMEQGGGEFDGWTRAEAAHARSTLDAIANREILRARIAGLDDPGSGVEALQARNGRWLYRQ